LTAKEDLKKLEILVHMLDPDFRYAIEVRHRSWFDDKNVYKLLSDNNICLAWSQMDIIQTPAELTSDFAYLRFIGDRSIDVKDFGKIQKNRLRFKLLEGEISPSGVIIASYERAGEVKIGSFGLETPSVAELARRKRLKEEG
jgi:uncharacterized protein YecE (DUF72 family)